MKRGVYVTYRLVRYFLHNSISFFVFNYYYTLKLKIASSLVHCLYFRTIKFALIFIFWITENKFNSYFNCNMLHYKKCFIMKIINFRCIKIYQSKNCRHIGLKIQLSKNFVKSVSHYSYRVNNKKFKKSLVILKIK